MSAPYTPLLPPPRPFRRWAGRLAMINLFVVFGVTIWFYTAADQNWIATLLLFGPRWLAFAPLALLIPLSLLTRAWKGLICCVLAAIAIAGPFMGGVVNLTSSLEVLRQDGTIRLITFNADNKDADREQFRAFIQEYQPDVICLQDADRITQADLTADYKLLPASNGLKMASKHPLQLISIQTNITIGPARGAAMYRVTLPQGVREIVTVHLPTARPGLEAILSRKPGAIESLNTVIKQRDQSSRSVRQWLGETPLIAGDFNLPPESIIFRRDWGGFSDAFADTGFGWGWTFHTHRNAVRIDHILCRPPWKIASFRIGPDLGSAHLPLIADLTP